MNKKSYDVNKIKIIQQFFRKCIVIYDQLDKINYNKSSIEYKDINVFNLSTRCKNDTNNKLRENIIGAIINNKIPEKYYKYSFRWKKLKDGIDQYLKKLTGKETINKQECVQKAGRGNHYDFKIIIDEVEYQVEFKFNAETVKDTPQFVSPMKPSQYLQSSYEEYYFDNYLTKLAEKYELELPDRETYLAKIHSNKPECVKEFQDKYYQGCKGSSKYTANRKDINFHKKAKEFSKESIKSFIQNNDLKKDKLTEYLLESQQNKCYMLYKKGAFNLQKINQEDYQIISYKKEIRYQRYVATTKSGIKMKILLRWKNGNGIAFPAFQIS